MNGLRKGVMPYSAQVLLVSLLTGLLPLRSLPPHLRNVDSPSSANSSQPSSDAAVHAAPVPGQCPGSQPYAMAGNASCNSMAPPAQSRAGSRSGSLVPQLPQLQLQPQPQDETGEAALRAKIQQLQEQLARVQTENASLSAKLSQQRWEVDQRLLDIEMHICGASSGNSSAADDRESFI
ncbi:Troponin T, slow skeletal muscle [Frankliniella fusca]|uniref:Troponin T, slow skeletal muscle n=1 Tax=Frankliniella fusca TaxID=407009 RepID=A0AAE1GV21_9NEOP|nr:Troponin T, slow skeletal muscle [Frankliniella fusca]